MPPSPVQPETAKTQKVIKKSITIVLVGLGIILGLPLLLSIIGVIYLFTFYSADPLVNEGYEKKQIQQHLKDRYGKDFTVENFQTKARKYLGDSQSISAEAYANDDKTVKIRLNKTLGYSEHYSDNYLALSWSGQVKQHAKPTFDSIYGQAQEYSLGVSPTVGYNTEYNLGRVISLEEAVETVPGALQYDFKIDAGQQGSREEHSAKLFSIKTYLDARYQSPNSGIWYDFSQGQEAYRCFLHGFHRQFVESDRQLWGCWYRSDKNAPSPVPTRGVSAHGIDITQEQIPIELPPWEAVTYTKVTDGAASDVESYMATYEGLPVRIEVKKGGFGEAINDAKKQYIERTMQQVPVASGMRTLTLKPDQAVGSYRRDEAPGYRKIHYVLVYKTFTVHVSATTQQAGYDTRDKEFWLYNFVGRFEAVSGFKET